MKTLLFLFLLVATWSSAPAQGLTRYRIIVAADPGSDVKLSTSSSAFNGEGLPTGTVEGPYVSRLQKIKLTATAEPPKKEGERRTITVQSVTKEIVLPEKHLKNIIIRQDVKRGPRGRITALAFKVEELPRPAKFGEMEVISYSAKPGLVISVNNKTMRIPRGKRVPIKKLGALTDGQREKFEDDGDGAKPLRIEANGEELFLDKVFVEEHLLVVLYDGADGKLRAVVAGP